MHAGPREEALGNGTPITSREAESPRSILQRICLNPGLHLKTQAPRGARNGNSAGEQQGVEFHEGDWCYISNKPKRWLMQLSHTYSPSQTYHNQIPSPSHTKQNRMQSNSALSSIMTYDLGRCHILNCFIRRSKSSRISFSFWQTHRWQMHQLISPCLPRCLKGVFSCSHWMQRPWIRLDREGKHCRPPTVGLAGETAYVEWGVACHQISCKDKQAWTRWVKYMFDLPSNKQLSFT